MIELKKIQIEMFRTLRDIKAARYEAEGWKSEYVKKRKQERENNDEYRRIDRERRLKKRKEISKWIK